MDPSGGEDEDEGVLKKLCVGKIRSSIKSEKEDKSKIKNNTLKFFSSSSAPAVGGDHDGQVAAQGAGDGGGRRGAVQNACAKNFSALQACPGRPDSAAAEKENGMGHSTFGKGRNRL